MPTTKTPDQPHLAGERLFIDTSTIALPGCIATKVIKAFSIDPQQKQLLSLQVEAGAEVRAIFKTDGKSKCERPLPDIPDGTIIEIALRERGPGGEVLAVTLFEKSAYDDLLASYTYELVPTPPGMKQQVKRKPRPKEIVNWTLIRAGYNACDEGSDFGAIICANAKLYEADGKLNSDWRRLTGILSDKDRASVVSQQRSWLKEVFSSCKEKNVMGWNDRWVYSFETICQAGKYELRAAQFRQAYECISTGKTNCLPLPELFD